MMLRSGCRLLVLLRTLARLGGAVALFMMRVDDLPVSVLVLSGMLFLCGVWISIPHRRRLRSWMLTGYFVLEAAADAVNLFLIGTYYPLKIGYWVTALTGNVLDILVAAACIYLLVLTPEEPRPASKRRDAQEA